MQRKEIRRCATKNLFLGGRFPGLESPGYSQPSLRDGVPFVRLFRAMNRLATVGSSLRDCFCDLLEVTSQDTQTFRRFDGARCGRVPFAMRLRTVRSVGSWVRC